MIHNHTKLTALGPSWTFEKAHDLESFCNEFSSWVLEKTALELHPERSWDSGCPCIWEGLSQARGGQGSGWKDVRSQVSEEVGVGLRQPDQL